jgi:hypothetical protein
MRLEALRIEMLTAGSGGRTITVAVALMAPVETVTVVIPGEIALTTPAVALVVAIAEFADVHRYATGVATPFASNACALR